MNEASSSMICAFHSVMDLLLETTLTRSGSGSGSGPGSGPGPGMREFYPELSFLLVDDWDFSSRLRPQQLPVIWDSPDLLRVVGQTEQSPQCQSQSHRNSLLLELRNRLAVQFGSFEMVYGPRQSPDHGDRFDLVVTCFFLDTAKDVLDYVDTIHHVLRPGGLWINVGPLHYHHFNRQRHNRDSGSVNCELIMLTINKYFKYFSTGE